MAVTRIKNNQITDSTIVGSQKIQGYSVTGGLLANNLTYGSNFTINGNLTVNGNTTTIDTNITTIEDPVIVLASTQTGAPAVDIGYIGERGTDTNIAFVWDESQGKFITAFTSTAETETTITVSSYASFKTLDAEVTGNLTVTGTSGFTGNITAGNIYVNPSKTIDVGNNIIGNAANPLANSDVATKAYVDQAAASTAFDITDGIVTDTITNGDTITFSGTVNEVTVAITATDTLTFGLPDDVVVTANLSANKIDSTTTITATGNLVGGNVTTAGVVQATGNVSGGNITTAGIVEATGNVIGGNVTTGGQVVATGNVTGGNLISTAGVYTLTVNAQQTVTATGNITGGNVIAVNAMSAGTTITATGNITGGNLSTAGQITATGNITGGNLISNGDAVITSNVSANNLTVTNYANVGYLNVLTGPSSFQGNVGITGNLLVAGNVTYIGVQDLVVDDPIIYLAANNVGDLDDIGFVGNWDDGLYQHGGLVRDHTDGVWKFFSNVVAEPTTVVDWANAIFDTVQVGALQAAGNITGNVNITASGFITATGNVTGGNIMTGGLVNATGNVTGGNLRTPGQVDATGDFKTAANIFALFGNTHTGNLIATANVNGVDLNMSGSIYAQQNGAITGNLSAGNIYTGGQADVVGNINGGNVFSSGWISATGNLSGGNIFTGGTMTATGNVIGGNVTTSGQVNATGNVTGGNIVAANAVNGASASFTGNITGGNLSTGGQVTATGNITGGNVIAVNGLQGQSVTASGNITGGNVISTGSGVFGNVYISGDDITDIGGGTLTFNLLENDVNFDVRWDNGTAFFVDGGTGTASFGSATQTTGALVAFNSTNSILFPVGNTAQRPGTPTIGMLRFNTTTDAVEVYSSVGWEAVGEPVFTVVSDQQFNGDGSTTTFTLSASSTTAGSVVSINGVVQIPTLAYAISGTSLVFTEAPASGDVIDVRTFTTTVSVSEISNQSANAVIAVENTSDTVSVTGNLIPTANVTYNLGNASNQWNDLYLSGNTIYLGGLQLQASGNTFVVYQSDGVTQANIDAGSIDVSAISSGTSVIGISGTNGNTYMTVGGVANVLVASTAGANITGTLGVTGTVTGGNLSTAGTATATGNITGGNIITAGLISASGNITGNYILGNGSQLTGIDATSIQNGTSNVRVTSSGGNVTVGVGGSGIGVFSTAGLDITGNATATGNVSGNYLLGNAYFVTGLSPTKIYNGTSEINIGASNGNANISIGGSSNVVVVTSTGANLTGTLNVSGISAFSSNVTIAGNLVVSGNVTYTGVNDLVVDDPLIYLAANNVANTDDIGIVGNFDNGTYQHTGFARDATDGTWKLFSNVIPEPTTTIDFTNAVYDPIRTGAITATTGTFSGNVSTGNVSGTNVTGTLLTAAQPNITSVGSLSSLTVTGNITGGNLSVSTGAVTLGSIVNANANGVGNIGSSTTYFNTVFAKATSAQYADLAEMYEADGVIEPGTVVAFGGPKEVTTCGEDGSRRVAGVVSTNPSYIMNAGQAGDNVVAVALTGRVPTKVTGTVRKGDLMVAAGNGRARAEANPAVGAVIGKALADFDGAEGVIEVVVGRF